MGPPLPLPGEGGFSTAEDGWGMYISSIIIGTTTCRYGRPARNALHVQQPRPRLLVKEEGLYVFKLGALYWKTPSALRAPPREMRRILLENLIL